MMRVSASLLCGVLFSLPASAQVGTWPPLVSVGGGAAAPFPTTQTVSFGQKTPFGYGGSDMAYTNQSVLGVSRWLKITAQVNSGSVSGTYFGIDDRNMLVPCATITSNKCSSSYGGTATRSATPYTVTVAEYSNSGRTTPTGNQSVITINTVANTYTIREMTAAVDGCTVNCEVDNPDSGDFQLDPLLATPLVAYGDTIIARTGYFNPSLANYRIQPSASPSGSGCATGGIGANCILIKSEVQDATLDSNGNPNLQNGFQIGSIHSDMFNVGDVALNWTFDHVWFYQNVASGSAQAMLFNNNNSGYGYSVTNSRIEWSCATSTPLDGITSNGFGTFSGNHFKGCPVASGGTNGGNGIKISAPGVALAHQGNATITSNIFENMFGDSMQNYGGPYTVTDNTFFQPQFFGTNHADTYQSVGGDDGQNYTGGTIARNLSVRGLGRSGWDDAQMVAFFKNDGGASPGSGTGTATFTNLTVTNNLSLLLGGNSLFLNMITPTISWNLNFSPTGTSCVTGTCQPDNPVPGDLSVLDFSSLSSGGTIAQNATNTFTSTQHGSPTISDNTQTAWASGSAATIYTSNGWPNYVTGEPSCPQYCSRASIISIMAPAFNNSTTTKAHNADGTYTGPLTPADSGGHPCWNTGITNFDNTKTCAAQSLTQAS